MSVRAHIAKRKAGKKITKVQVRDGVVERLPHLAKRFKPSLKIYEESDAWAIALYSLDKLVPNF